jgi:hypothetical protein
MDAEEIVDEIMEEAQMFELDVRPGWSDDSADIQHLTRVLPRPNRVYRDLVREGIHQCYVTKTLETDTIEYRVPKEIGFVSGIMVYDGEEWVELTVTDRDTLKEKSKRWRSVSSGMPTEYWFDSNIYGFDRPPDDTYDIKILADVIPTMMAAREDIPEFLPELQHDVLVSGGVVRLLRMSLNMKSMTEFGLMRFQSHYSEYQDLRKYTREVANGRVLNYTKPIQIHDGYRVESAVGRRYR